MLPVGMMKASTVKARKTKARMKAIMSDSRVSLKEDMAFWFCDEVDFVLSLIF